MICETLLVPSDDDTDFVLVENNNFPRNDTTLDLIIPEFFTQRSLSTHIAIVCGATEKWTVEQFRTVVASHQTNVPVIAYDSAQPPDATSIEPIYTALNDQQGASVEAMTGNSFMDIANILEGINSRLVPNATGETVRDTARLWHTMGEACKSTFFPFAFSEDRAVQITNRLKSLHQSNSFPQLMILIYLPSGAFSYFATKAHHFPKQIEYVLKIQNPYETIENLKQQVDTLQEEVNSLRKQLGAAQAEKDRIIAEKNKQIADLQQQILRLTQFLQQQESPEIVVVSSLPENSLSESNVQLYESVKPLLEILNYYNKQGIHFNIELDDTIKSNPYYAEFVSTATNSKNNKNTSNPFVNDDTNKLTLKVIISPKQEIDAKTPDAAEPSQLRNNDSGSAPFVREKDF